ncbi:MAG: family 10 glycosylhydrolase [Lentisphaeria bacterium]
MLKPTALLVFYSAFLVALSGQQLDLRKAAANCIPSAAAALPNNRNFGGKQPGLELKAEFSTNGANRACWDFPLQINLAQMAALRIRFRCFNVPIVSQFNIYILAGNTWYSCKFSPQVNGKWEEAILPKSSFLPEGSSNSWQNCRKIRIATWRGSPGTLYLQFAGIEFISPNVSIALLRSGGNSEQQKEAYQYASHLGNNLSQGGLYPAVIEEDDCSARLLYPYQLLLLPYSAASSAGQISAVTAYLRNNGRVGVFHTLPPLLAAQLKLPAGNFLRVRSLPRPLAAVQPELASLPNARTFRQQSTSFISVKPGGILKTTAWWLDTSGQNTGYPALLEVPYGFWMTHVFLNQDSEAGFQTLLAQMSRFIPGLQHAAAAATLNRARFAYANSGMTAPNQAGNVLQAANRLFLNGNDLACRDYANRCLNYLSNASIPQTPPRENEFRAVWCRNPDGLPGLSWLETIRTLKASGFNAIFPNLAHASLGADQNIPRISACLQACHSNGVRLHLWLSCLGVADLPDALRQQFAAEGRLQKKENGAVLPWLCPSQKSNRQMLVNTALALAKKYPLDGLHLDLIRYPGSQSCFCKSCQLGFSEFLGRRLTGNWPELALDPQQERKNWEEYRRRQITSLVQEIRQAVKSVRPEMQLSAAVYTDWQNARSTVGQDWVTWQKQQLLDFVCPMNYRATAALFASDLTRQKQQLGGVNELLPGIGVSSERFSLEELARQIQCCRHAGTAGFILFEYTPRVAHDLLPALKKTLP